MGDKNKEAGSEEQQEQTNYGKRSTDEVNFKFPFASGRVSGEKVILLVVIALAVAPMMYGLFLHHEENKERLGRLEQAIDANTYVLTLSGEKRELLNLQKPRRIREMERSANE